MDNASKRLDRRDLLKKTLALGTAGYVAPMIVGSVTTVSAQAPSGGVCLQNDSCATFSCGGGACACVPTTSGATVCVTPDCTANTVCTSNASCATGFVCFTLGCCGQGNFCVPLCNAGNTAARPTSWRH
jgi:hypothetical protein